MNLICVKGIAEITGFSVRHVAETLIFQRDFPDCFNLGRTGRRWEREDVFKWIRSKRERL